LSTSSRANPQRLGKYELQERLGHGGMAEVWKAFDTELHRYIAIKLLHANLRTDPGFIARFSREARCIAALHHPNIVQLHDFQTTHFPETNTPIAYMVMDYVEGETLAQYIHRTARAGQFPAPTDIIHLFASISQAIDYAHQESMIHRDIKPANILLDKRHIVPDSIGKPVLTDFGIARIVGTSSDTMSGMWLGTPLYISPEQALGRPVSKQSDIYSLGVILYEICTGVCPFQNGNFAFIIMQHINAVPKSPDLINPAIPPALTATILQALAKDPAARFSSATALTVAIAEAYRLPIPADLFTPAHPSNPLLEATDQSLPRPSLSPYATRPEEPQSQPLPVMDSMSQPSSAAKFPPPTPPSRAPQSEPLPVTDSASQPSSAAKFLHPTPPWRAPQSEPLPVTDSASQPSPVAGAKLPHPTPPSKAWKGNLIAWFAVLLVLVSSIIISLYALDGGHASPATPTTPQTVGTLTFTNSGQYDLTSTVGYNDIVTLSLHSLTTPGIGMAYFVWLMPDPGDDEVPPLLLGRIAVKAGDANLQYASPTHTNLLVQYSGVRITEQSALNDPSTPSPDPKTWRWQGWIPHTPTPGDTHQYSLLSHVRHLLAKDPTLQANNIPGGLVLWMTRNVAKVQEWCSATQGGWGPQMSDGDADLIHRNLLRILDYLDGQTYVEQDVPTGSPWLADPALPGKLGLLSHTQGQQPPGYLPHVNTHLTALAESPGHTDEQKQVAIQVDDVIARMINDLTQVRKDAVQLVQRSNEQLLQPDTLTLLNEMTALTGEANSGWFDMTTHENVGGAIWLNERIQQMATISLQTSNLQ
jgi:eukaryotic-like serine/threonine-protein kinase